MPTLSSSSNQIRIINYLDRESDLKKRSRPLQVLLFIGLHIPMLLLFQTSTIFPTIHALLTFVIGLFLIIKDEKPDRPIYILAYIAGSELLWRGLHANLFWEFGKYSTMVLLLFMNLKYRGDRKTDLRGMFFILFLVPSVFILPTFNREEIAFALAGPMVLALAVTFFSRMRISINKAENMLVAFMGPVTALAFQALAGIITTENIVFINASLSQTSGGIGPNQVSSTFGLGSLAAFLYFIIQKNGKILKLLTFGWILWFLSQTALTFSRGGLWTSIGAILVAAYYLQKDKRQRPLFYGTIFLLALTSYLVIFPVLNQFTGFMLQRRLSDLDLTRRDQLIRAELQVFMDHPVLGVGPGQISSYFGRSLGFKSSSHTEYTRILAEHGVSGIFSLIFLLVITLERIFKKGRPSQKLFSVAFTAWALLYMFHSATRTVAPALLFGLGSLEYSDMDN